MRIGLLALLILAAVTPEGWTHSPSRKAHPFISRFGFTDAEIASMAAGEVVTRLLETKQDNDVAIVGVVHVDAPETLLVEPLRELVVFLKDGSLLETGHFSSPPRVDDLDGLSFDTPDLRKCKPGNCEVQMGAAGMELAKRVDWKSPTAEATFVGLLKQSVVDEVVAYQRDGRMPVYVNNARPESVAEGLHTSLKDSPYLALDSPFIEYLVNYPKAALPDTEDVFFWTRQDVKDPVTSVHHLVIHKTLDGDTADYTIADKHIADSHYFLASLEVVWLLRDADAKPGFYAARLNRSRIDPPRLLRGLLLGKIKKGMRKAMGQSLKDVKMRLEAAGPGAFHR